MIPVRQKKSACSRVISAIALVFSSALISCSESEADVVSVSATAVFDFKDMESAPDARLAVFLQVTNEVQRTDFFTVSNEQSGYSWSVKRPGIFTGLNKNYAYALNLTAPEGKPIPTGDYSATYFDAAGNEDDMKFTVTYSDGLLTSNSSTCKDFMSSPGENLAVYDDTGELLFMGKAKSSWRTNEAILKDYKLAATKRVCYVSPGNSVICLMPAESLRESEESES